MEKVRSFLKEATAKPAQQSLDLGQLKDILPTQKVAPIQFEIINDKISIAKVNNRFNPIDRRNIESARSELIKSGSRVIEELNNKNHDPKLIESLVHLQEKLESSEDNIIAIGFCCLSCEFMRSQYNNELSDSLNGMIRAHIMTVDMFVGQFPDWQRFLENAALSNLDTNDISRVKDANASIIREMENNSSIVDGKIPNIIKRINELLDSPGPTAKKAAFAAVRSIENLVSKIFSYGAEFFEQTIKKTIGGLSTTASAAVIAGMLGLAMHGAGQIGPIASKISEMSWMRDAVSIVEKQLETLRLK